ncbi:MAG: cytochrome c biogenesis protein ResB [Planctomycetota bacterium]
MNKLRREIMWAALALIILLTVLSVYGAFIGADRAQAYFNSVPLAIFWGILALALIAGLVVFRRLIRVPGLLLMHAGCILILGGGALGSKMMHELSGSDKVRAGQMQIYEGQTQNQVYVRKDQQSGDGEDHEFKTLPFSIKLCDFRIEYYEPAYLQVETGEGQSKTVSAEIGNEIDLGGELGMARIVRMFENFKMSIEGDKRVAYEDPNPGLNPALEVLITKPDGQMSAQYVFSFMPGFSHTEGGAKLTYSRPANRAISDYISELEVTDKEGKVVAAKDIEVNHPLRYGGYHFYQSSYDPKAGQYTILSVHSDAGLGIVYTGYWMLCLGVVWHLWLRHIVKKIGGKKHANGN